MLSKLHIENIALIDFLDLDIPDGFVVMTGETGAGKSIVIDAVNLVLGERADRSLIQTGKKEAFVQALFDVQSENIKAILEKYGVDVSTNEVLLSRELTTVGKNTCRINGRLCTLSELHEISKHLVDIHGQHEHQTLLKSSSHIEFLDGFADNELIEAKNEYIREYRKLNKIIGMLKDDNLSDKELAEKEKTLKEQIAEIDEADLTVSEEQELEIQRNMLMNREQIQSAIDVASEALEGELNGEWLGASSLVALGIERLSEISKFSSEIEKIVEAMRELFYELEDIALNIRNQGSSEDFDPYTYDEIESRLHSIYILKKKYGNSIKEVLEFKDSAQYELEKTIEIIALIKKGEAELEKQRHKAYKLAKELSYKRRFFAEKLENAMMGELSQLGMDKAVFSVGFNDFPEESNKIKLKSSGLDEVEFLLSANSGENLKPLSKVASGGELSRIMLAFKSISASSQACETVIFDEIDTGISGGISEVVGKKMKKISVKHQVISVTHSAQIAALADAHFFISKSERDGKTKTHVATLNYEERINEIGRIISGANMSKNALEHAKLMIDQGN